jgi:hypothetical protein
MQHRCSAIADILSFRRRLPLIFVLSILTIWIYERLAGNCICCRFWSRSRVRREIGKEQIVKLSNTKEVANQSGPESCTAHREVRDEALFLDGLASENRPVCSTKIACSVKPTGRSATPVFMIVGY